MTWVFMFSHMFISSAPVYFFPESERVLIHWKALPSPHSNLTCPADDP